MKVSEITKAVAQYLDDVGVANYYPDVFPPTITGPVVSIKRLPKSPDDAVAVTVYDVDDALIVPGTWVSVQLRFRTSGSRTSVDDLADAVFEHLHFLHRFDMAGVLIQRARRINMASLGPDENGRDERADNYELLLA